MPTLKSIELKLKRVLSLLERTVVRHDKLGEEIDAIACDMRDLIAVLGRMTGSPIPPPSTSARPKSPASTSSGPMARIYAGAPLKLEHCNNGGGILSVDDVELNLTPTLYNLVKILASPIGDEESEDGPPPFKRKETIIVQMELMQEGESEYGSMLPEDIIAKLAKMGLLENRIHGLIVNISRLRGVLRDWGVENPGRLVQTRNPNGLYRFARELL